MPLGFFLLACTAADKPARPEDSAPETLDTDTHDSAPPDDTSAPDDSGGTVAVDADGDGVPAREDCDDSDPAIYPGAPETCATGDIDCDGAVTCDIATEALWAFQEDAHSGHWDGATTSFGDVDGDGLADLLIGGPGGNFDGDYNEPDGHVHIVLSAMSRAAGTYSLTGDAAWTLLGDGNSHSAGYPQGATLLPDLDGDGRAELLVGAEWYGAAWLITGATLVSAPSEAFLSEVADQELRRPGNAGSGVSLAGDFDGDGVPELAVSDNPSVWVVPFDLSSTYRSLEDGVHIVSEGADTFGYAVAPPGDVDGDGLDDLLIGDYTADFGANLTGVALVYSGGSAAWGTELGIADAALSVYGGERNGVGIDVRGVGDWDGDGVDDWALTSIAAEDGAGKYGAVYVVTTTAGYTGGSLPADDATLVLRGVQALSIDSGDFDGDASTDLAVIAGSYDERRAIVLPGAVLPPSGVVYIDEAGWVFRADGATDVYGSVHMDADVTGDGLDDLLIPDFDWGTGHRGAAWLIPGR